MKFLNLLLLVLCMIVIAVLLPVLIEVAKFIILTMFIVSGGFILYLIIMFIVGLLNSPQ